jgi:Amt family ammonium transporter
MRKDGPLNLRLGVLLPALILTASLLAAGAACDETRPPAPAGAPASADPQPDGEAGKVRAPTLEERIADLEALANSRAPELRGRAAALPVNTGDNAWVLVSAALVLLMTAPGLVLFYGGLVRRKNVLSTMMHSLFLMGLVSVLWVVYGYSMAFGEGNAYYGNPLQYFMLNGVGGAPNPDYAPTIPHQTFMLFQMMFAIITPALISGAYAERVKFSSMILFTVLWSTFIYFPMAHMVWGKGGLFNWALPDAAGKVAAVPLLDFAGGTVVHITSGLSALVFALVLGRREGYPARPMPPHNLVLTLAGAALLWFGWFGFNAGSALNCGSLASSAFGATHFAAATAALVWAGCEWILRGKPSALGTASGMVAGLATVTQGAGFVSVPSAMLIGALAGGVCFMACWRLKTVLGYDDSLDAFGVHGIGGMMGCLLTGLLASAAINPAIANTYQVGGQLVSLAGPEQVVNQFKVLLVAVALAVGGTWIILRVVNAVCGLRVTLEHEVGGLDISQHGEEAYNNA